MFKIVVILCLAVQQQCFVVEHKTETPKLYKTEAECSVASERVADGLLAELEGKVMQPYFVRYGCEKVDTI